MVTFGGNAVAGASVNTNPFLSEKVETFGRRCGRCRLDCRWARRLQK